ncbi:MAG: hypothetical protein R2864_12385 [Syntrophotaleaceae bacterium]
MCQWSTRAFNETIGGNSSYRRRTEGPLALLVPLSITAAISMAIGIYPDFFLRLAEVVHP